MGGGGVRTRGLFLSLLLLCALVGRAHAVDRTGWLRMSRSNARARTGLAAPLHGRGERERGTNGHRGVAVAGGIASGLCSSHAAALGAALASFLQGYHTGIVGGALLSLSPEFALHSNPKLLGLIVTGTTMGSVCGTASAARLADGLGRRATLLFASIVSIAGSLLLCTAGAARRLVLARVLTGVAIGIAGAVVPVYIAETAPAEQRGALAAIPQTFVSLGALTAICPRPRRTPLGCAPCPMPVHVALVRGILAMDLLDPPIHLPTSPPPCRHL